MRPSAGWTERQEIISNPTADKLFYYLRDVLYYPRRAQLDVASLPEDFRELGEGLAYFAEMLGEVRALAKSLSRGDLSGKLPCPGNELASDLKSLHAVLKHLTWQTRQVAAGDYDQHVEFMGDFASAFNQMIAQLKERRETMRREIEIIQKQRQYLERSNSLFEIITSRMSEWIAVIDRETGERLFANRPIESVLTCDAFESELYDILMGHAKEIDGSDNQKIEELHLTSGAVTQWFSAILYPLRWYEHDAVAVVLTDTTTSMAEINRLEEVANRDTLTGTYNRYYGMNLLSEWNRRHIAFVICFVDMDRLKYVNDVFGHAEGDRYILQVAKLLQAFSAESCVCRLGGDEFMILGTGISQKAAETRLEALRDSLVAEKFVTEDGVSYRGSISYGVVEVAAGNRSSAGDFLSMADEKMYAYKKAHKVERRD
ncbi:MAG: diguanylate cyclase, partial [Candidatus Accumulibacter sp.]|nr:diguanylate cyclase [Accumulibacter sp.]